MITDRTNGTVYRLTLLVDALRQLSAKVKWLDLRDRRSRKHTVVVKSVDSGMWISYMCLTELTILRVRSPSTPNVNPNFTQAVILRKDCQWTRLTTRLTKPGWRWETMIKHVCADSPLLAWFHGVAPFHQTVIEQRNNVCYNPACLLSIFFLLIDMS